MYRLEYLQSALNDITEIIGYIVSELKNPIAARNLSEQFLKAAENLTEFPYFNPLYNTVKPLKYEYRKIVIGNYIMFYWIDEINKTVVISRVIYAKRDYGRYFFD